MENKNEQVLDDFDLEKESVITQTWHSKIGKWVAIVSFVIGTTLFIAGTFFGALGSVMIAGIYFVIGAFFINLLVAFVLLITGTTDQEKSINRKMARMMLLNIPIAIVYFMFIARIVAIPNN